MQRKTNNKFLSGDCDMLVSGPLLNTLYFYFLSAYWLISPDGGGRGGLIYETDGDARRRLVCKYLDLCLCHTQMACFRR